LGKKKSAREVKRGTKSRGGNFSKAKYKSESVGPRPNQKGRGKKVTRRVGRQLQMKALIFYDRARGS